MQYLFSYRINNGKKRHRPLTKACSKRDLESQMFHNLWKIGDEEEVIRLCKLTPDGPLHKCSIYNDTLLHEAIYMKRHGLANKLLDHHLPDSLVKRLPNQLNDWGDTVLHNAATSDKGLGITKKLFQKSPQLLRTRNNWGETPAFQAARYGKLEAFKYLSHEIDQCESNQGYDLLHFLRRDDGITVLHMAILTRNFGIALWIANKYPVLCGLRASENTMTPLQMLACSPTALKSGTDLGSNLKKLVYSSIEEEEEEEVEGGTETESDEEEEEEEEEEREEEDKEHKGDIVVQKVASFIIGMRWKPRCMLPILEAVKEVKTTHKRAKKLAKLLIKQDTTWKEGPKPRPEYTPEIACANDSLLSEDSKAGNEQELGTSYYRKRLTATSSSSSSSSSSSIPDAKEIPLILAAKHGCVEIVKEILKQFPQAVEYLNYEQQTFLHVAIKNRNLEVFKLIDPKTSPIRAQLRAIDVNGNSILHMVGHSSTTRAKDNFKMKSPVIRLSEDLLLLEYLKSLCPSCLIHHHNSDMMTADQLFATNYEKLREEAQEWLKRTAEHCTVVIVLIATVAFASAYTVPGGPNSQTGYPILITKPLFLVFTVADVLSLGFALTAVVIFLSILTSSFQMKEFRRSLPEKLLLGFTLLFLSVSMMMVAFAATIILMINNKERWTKIGVYVVAFFPVCIFMLSYIPLYVKLVQSLRRWALKIGNSLPRITCDSKPSRKQNKDFATIA